MLVFRTYSFLRDCLRFGRDEAGNFAIVTSLLMPVIIVAAGGAVDVTNAMLQKTELQGRLDAGVLSAVQLPDLITQRKEILSILQGSNDDFRKLLGDDPAARLSVEKDADEVLSATFSTASPTNFLRLAGLPSFVLNVRSDAVASPPASNGCIYVLGNENQSVLINSGANLVGRDCTIEVASTANPAFIMNSSAVIDTARFCVKGTRYIRNGGTLSNLVTGCPAAADPYPSLPEPIIPQVCTTSGWRNGNVHTINPGLHCDTGFNGSPTITFSPGLHIIRGRMVINSNATIVATGVTFYFPDVNSEIRINGGVNFTASAPTSGPYKGLLMYEKTSHAGNNANTQQYVFNGSNGENLQGIIHLPNRNVTYNSTTNVASKITLVVNTMIMNSSSWKVEPYGLGGAGGSAAVRLVR